MSLLTFDWKTRPRLPNLGLAQIVAGGLLAVAALTSVIAGTFAERALGELKSLRSEVVATRDELTQARQRTAALEQQLEAVARTQEQQLTTASIRTPSEQATEKRGDRPAFRLTQDEAQLLRSYIKASPASSDAVATISVGAELRHMPMVPLPAPIVGKIPRLGGSRFTIDRNGAIVISLRNSKVADAIVQPNQAVSSSP